MINTFFVGRLGADAEVKTSKNGNNFVTFRVAVDDFNNGAKSTTWVSVTDFTANAVTRAQYLKKGSCVEVSGTLTTRIYTTRDNTYQVGVDVMANSVNFVRVGGQNENSETVTTTDSATAKPIPTTTIDCGTLKRPETVQITSPSVAVTSGDADEDLPF